MTLDQIAGRLDLEDLTPELTRSGSPDIARGYAADLLSDVLANGPRGGLLVTIQAHMNVVAVASHTELAGVIFAAGRRPEEEVRLKAVEEGIRLLRSEQSAFDIVGRLYELGIRGPAD